MTWQDEHAKICDTIGASIESINKAYVLYTHEYTEKSYDDFSHELQKLSHYIRNEVTEYRGNGWLATEYDEWLKRSHALFTYGFHIGAVISNLWLVLANHKNKHGIEDVIDHGLDYIAAMHRVFLKQKEKKEGE